MPVINDSGDDRGDNWCGRELYGKLCCFVGQLLGTDSSMAPLCPFFSDLSAPVLSGCEMQEGP